ncbi:hypothetical protein [Streptomyces sp. NPDC046821]|uniref:hypothetical protein n=1 Tax=Streptomyces sp. NPDC046821 TaxID=3154702 RepID=UPI0033C76E26
MTKNMRLLPWKTPEGKPCYLSSDGDGTLARLADEVEAVQLNLGEELLGHARKMLGEPDVPAEEFRFLSARLAEALDDALRVAGRVGESSLRESPGEVSPGLDLPIPARAGGCDGGGAS